MLNFGTTKGGAPEGWGPKIFPSPATFFILLSLGGPFLEFSWCLKRRDLEMCTFGISGCRVKPRRLRGRRGFTRQPKFHERTPKREKKEKCGGRREKKRAKFLGGPAEGCPAEGCPVESLGCRGFGFSSGFWGQRQKQNKNNRSRIVRSRIGRSRASSSSTAGTIAVDGAPLVAWTFLSFASASASSNLPTCGLSCHSGDARPRTWRGCSVSGALCVSLALALALALIELAVFRCVSGTSTRSIPFLCFHQRRQRPSASRLRWVPTPLLDHPCPVETLTCPPVGPATNLTTAHFGSTQECKMPGLRLSCRLRRFQEFPFRTLSFAPSQ